jgi:hypothetical protein
MAKQGKLEAAIFIRLELNSINLDYNHVYWEGAKHLSSCGLPNLQYLTVGNLSIIKSKI